MLRKSRVRDWILEQWTPSSLWMPEHSMQVRMPKFVESHVGSEWEQDKCYKDSQSRYA